LEGRNSKSYLYRIVYVVLSTTTKAERCIGFVILQILKVVGNEKGVGSEAGYCSKTVSDCGDRCLLLFNFVLVFSSTNFRFHSVKTS
jgi:hypothetical protein